MYVGADHSGRDNDKGLASDSKKCNIVIDSGRGTLMTRGAYGSHLYNTSGEFGSAASSAGLSFVGSTATLVGQQAAIVTADLRVQKGSGSIQRPEITKKGVARKNTYTLPSSTPTVSLFGTLRASGQLQAVGAISTEDRLYANKGADYLERPRQKYLDINMPSENASEVKNGLANIPVSIAAALEEQITAELLSEKGHSFSDFAYTDSKTMGVEEGQTYFRETKWQRLLTSPGKWDEKPITHAILGDTYPYPGKEAYEENLKILLTKEGTEIKKTSFKDYKTNT